MKFTANKHYYIHNFGIDYQPIFFSQDNRDYFTRKIHKYIEPYAEVISIQLADNQFHILIKTYKEYSGTMLNHNIGIMLRSYTRAINKRRNRFGSLFCRNTKAFGRLSDIPKRLREFVSPFIELIQKGQLINFSKTVNKFFKFIKTEKDVYLDSPLSFKEVFKHPSKMLTFISTNSPPRR